MRHDKMPIKQHDYDIGESWTGKKKKPLYNLQFDLEKNTVDTEHISHRATDIYFFYFPRRTASDWRILIFQ